MTQSTSPSLRQWRVTTAIRVFTLALAAGSVASSGTLSQAAPLLAAIALVAGVTTVLETGTPTASKRWVPVGEALLVALLLLSVPEQAGVLVYLAVPPIVAGVRFGLVAAANATFVAVAAAVVTLMVSSEPDGGERLSRAGVWLVVGFGVGLLASWQLKSVRDVESRQAPYAAANQLMSQLHHLARRGRLGLDSVELASELERTLRRATRAEQIGVFVLGHDGHSNLLACHGDRIAMSALHDQLGATAPNASELAELPLRSGDRLRGRVILVRTSTWTHDELAASQAIADDYVLRLDTAVLFDDVRDMATAEERNRIAREMHDGVAQEIVALGYVVDEIETVSNEPEIRALAASLRAEISRVVTELRLSIFDLRHQVTQHRLPAALSEYVRELSNGTDLRVHLMLDESGPPLPMWMESELLRIAQEAISNVRKHARAQNLWVTLVSDGVELALRIEDDGVGNAVPRERHWGLQTMTERAERIGARLTLNSRPGGGTVVSLSTRETPPIERTDARDHHRAPR